MSRERAAPARCLTLTEYETTPAVPLSAAERDTLAQIIPSLSIVPSLRVAGRFDLTPGSTVGAILVGALAVEIRPKLPLSNVLFLVSYANDPERWRDERFDHAASALGDAIVPAFLHHVRRATRRGLLHGYRTQDDALSTVRGRIRVEGQLRRHYGSAPPVAIRYDDFTADVDENRLLAAALERLRHLTLPPQRAEELRCVAHRFAEVTVPPYQRRTFPDPPLTPLNRHYASALRLARLILGATSFDLGHGPVPATGFMVDMARVFEDFVVAALRTALSLDEWRFPQGLGWSRHGTLGTTMRKRLLPLDTSGAVHLQPDLSWWEGGDCVFVGDAKYKRTSGTAGEHADLYQLLAYTVAAGLPGGLLIYASGDELPTRHEVRRAGKHLHVVSLDLTVQPAAILAQIANLAALIRSLRTAARRTRRVPA